MEWATGQLRPDPKNREIFDPLGGDEMAALVESIREHGIINPITVRPDGEIIAGEQRWHAARIAGLATVPVTIRDADDTEIELVRIEENLRRRTLTTSETAKAIRRLYELRGVRRGGRNGRNTSRARDHKTPLERIAAELGFSGRTVGDLRRLADLVPSLSALLDSEDLRMKAAFQLAQLDAGDQERVAAALTPEELAGASDAEILALKRDIKAITASGEEREAALRARIEQLRRERDAAAEAAERRLTYAARWARQDVVHRAIEQLAKAMAIAPESYAATFGHLVEIDGYIDADIEFIGAAIDWLRDLERHLRAARQSGEKGLRALK